MPSPKNIISFHQSFYVKKGSNKHDKSMGLFSVRFCDLS